MCRFTGKTTERERLEASLIHQVSLDKDIKLPVADNDGVQPIVVAFMDDSAGDVMERTTWSAGYVNVIVADPTIRHHVRREPNMAPASHAVANE